MKIFAFAGLQHHYLKLKDLAESLRERDHDVLWLVANNAINIDLAADYMIRNNETFVHLYDYLTPDRQRYHYGLVDGVSPFWSAYSLREASDVYSAIGNLIDRESPDAMMVLHENNFWGRLIALSCKQYSIPCYSFQEGMLRQSDQGSWNKQGLAADSSTVLFCWSSDDERQYLDAGVPQDRLFVSGPCHLDKYHGIQSAPNRVVTLAMPLISHWKGNLVDDVRRLSEFCGQSGLHLYVRFHPREVEYGHQLLNGIAYNKYDEYDPLPLISQSGVVLVQHSTVALEAIGLGISVIEYTPSASEPIEQSWYSHYQVSPRIDKYDLLPLIVDAIENGYYKVNEDWRMTHIPVDGMARERVRMVIENENTRRVE